MDDVMQFLNMYADAFYSAGDAVEEIFRLVLPLALTAFLVIVVFGGFIHAAGCVYYFFLGLLDEVKDFWRLTHSDEMKD